MHTLVSYIKKNPGLHTTQVAVSVQVKQFEMQDLQMLLESAKVLERQFEEHEIGPDLKTLPRLHL